MATPDIRLVVGVDTGLTYSSMKDGITEVIQRIEKENPPKIKIQFDDTEIHKKIQSLKSQLTEISNQKISIGATSTNIDAKIAKISSGIELGTFKTQVEGVEQSFRKLTNTTTESYNTISSNISKLQEAYSMMNNLSAAPNERIAAYERYNQILSAVTKQIRAQTTEEKAAAQAANKTRVETARNNKAQIAENESVNAQRKVAYQLLTRITQAQKDWTKARSGTTSNEYANLQTYITQLNSLIGRFDTKSIANPQFVEQVKEINSQFSRTSAVIRGAGEATKTLHDRFGALGEKFSMWFSATRIIMMVYTNIRKMISASIELDKVMNQLQIVTKENDESMTQFGNSAAAAARRIGSSITDFVSSATTYARLGYSLNESSQLAEFTAMLQNVGDIDVSEAQDAITSIIKAFNIGTDQIESVMDKMVVSGNNFPISVSQIAEGMKNASSALAAAGNNFDQSVALLTAANTTINLCRVA